MKAARKVQVHDYETRRDNVARSVWETWTEDGFNLSEYSMNQTMKAVQDAADNVYVEGMSDSDWGWKTFEQVYDIADGGI